ncbi:hypothetical protein GQ42DRAFT_62632 [Ramicandelaber brevisporus]|nr:hypothetical protein GQ42DRAFT_62632 [Ramicandelaber brevisporus]
MLLASSDEPPPAGSSCSGHAQHGRNGRRHGELHMDGCVEMESIWRRVGGGGRNQGTAERSQRMDGSGGGEVEVCLVQSRWSQHKQRHTPSLYSCAARRGHCCCRCFLFLLLFLLFLLFLCAVLLPPQPFTAKKASAKRNKWKMRTQHSPITADFPGHPIHPCNSLPDQARIRQPVAAISCARTQRTCALLSRRRSTAPHGSSSHNEREQIEKESKQ